MIEHDSFFVGGRWAKPHGSDVLDVVNPATEEIVGRVPVAVAADVDDAVAAARDAFDLGDWPRLSPKERIELVERLIELLEPRADELTALQIDEMGAPFSFMNAVTRAYLGPISRLECDLAGSFGFEAVQSTLVGDVLIRQEPVGVIGAIIPWNGPIGLILKKLVPALLSGSTIVLKPAPETPLDPYIVAEACQAAGFPEGVISIIPGGREAGAHLVAHPGVDLVTMTGSSAAGRQIASEAGSQMKRFVLELGGKSAGIVLDDADIDATLESLVVGSMQNTGQVCAAISRLLIPRSRYAEYADRFCSRLSELKLGDPHDPETFFGPLVAERQRDRVESYIRLGREAGATVVMGGGRPAGRDRGWWVEPTVFTDVTNDMRIAREEIFGPVVVMIPYDTDDEAVAIANDSPYGLSGAVFTADAARGLAVARRVRTGSFAINQFTIPFGCPFGGFKSSGIGREGGYASLQAYTETKVIALPKGFDGNPAATD